MLVYIVRRLIAAVILLLIVTAATFVIFFVVPRLGGATVDDLASRYVGKSGSAADIHAIAVKLGFTDPICVQYGRFVAGLFVGADYNTGPDHRALPRAVPRLLVHQPEPGVARSARPTAGDAVARGGRRGALAGRRRERRRALGAAARAACSTGRRWASRWPACRCRSSSPACCALSIFSYTLGFTAPGGSYTPFEVNPLNWAYDLILPWITLAFLYAAGYARLTRAGMLETMGEDYIRTARAKGLPERTVVVKHGLRSALTPILTIFGLDLGLLLGGAILTESTYSLPGIGQVLGRRDRQQRPAEGARRDAAGQHLHRAGQPGRRPAVRRHRPEGEVGMSASEDGSRAVCPRRSTRSGRSWTSATCGCTSRPTTAWSSRSTACRSSWSGARRSASSASRARARA